MKQSRMCQLEYSSISCSLKGVVEAPLIEARERALHADGLKSIIRRKDLR